MAMRRLLLILLVLPLCFGSSGCFLLRALLWPAQTAQALVASVTNNIAEGLTGGVDAITSNAESIENIDQILADHPDAANAESLRRLRDELAQESSGAARGSRSERAVGDVEGYQEGELVSGAAFDEPLVLGEHDRHRENFPVISGTGAVNDPTTRHRARTSFAVEHPGAPQIRQRQRESRNTVLLHRTELPQPESEIPLMHLESDGQLHHNIPMGGNILQARTQR